MTTAMEKLQNRRTIVERLRFGRDCKETGMLKNFDTGCYCFQGIIADEFAKANPDVAYWNGEVFMYNRMTKTAWLPDDVIKWSGFSTNEIHEYTAINDDDRLDLTLRQIGRLISLRDGLGDRE